MISEIELDCLRADTRHCVYSLSSPVYLTRVHRDGCTPKRRDTTKSAEELCEDFKQEVLRVVGLAEHPLVDRIKATMGKAYDPLDQLVMIEVIRQLSRILIETEE